MFKSKNAPLGSSLLTKTFIFKIQPGLFVNPYAQSAQVEQKRGPLLDFWETQPRNITQPKNNTKSLLSYCEKMWKEVIKTAKQGLFQFLHSFKHKHYKICDLQMHVKIYLMIAVRSCKNHNNSLDFHMFSTIFIHFAPKPTCFSPPPPEAFPPRNPLDQLLLRSPGPFLGRPALRPRLGTTRIFWFFLRFSWVFQGFSWVFLKVFLDFYEVLETEITMTLCCPIDSWFASRIFGSTTSEGTEIIKS